MRWLPSIRFLAATIRHKRFVYQAGRRLGVARWQLLVHDLSKLRPSELVPYGRFFHAHADATWRKAVPDPQASPHMRRAWLRHIQRNPHHWQHWVIVNGASAVSARESAAGGGGQSDLEALPMPERYVREMLADWLGAGRGQQGAYPASVEAWTWWQRSKDEMVLHDETRRLLAAAMAEWFGGP